jgi:hypothetical protein
MKFGEFAARIVYGENHDLLCINPDTTLMVSATRSVLNAKDSNAWTSASLRSSREEMVTSETWKVIPITKEK